MAVFTMLKEVISKLLLNRFVLSSVCSESRTGEEYHNRCNNDDCHTLGIKICLIFLLTTIMGFFVFCQCEQYTSFSYILCIDSEYYGDSKIAPVNNVPLLHSYSCLCDLLLVINLHLCSSISSTLQLIANGH